MRIDLINISNYLHATGVSIKPTTPVTLIAGHNGSGKSSIRDAIHHALTGEASRVKLKKEYDLLVSDKNESGFAEIITGENEAFSIVIPSGKGSHSDNQVLPYVLDAQRFARLSEKERRSYLFGISGVKLDPQKICNKMFARGCDSEKVERIKPMLRAGFDATMKEAENKAKEAKGGWKTITGGETWGKDKGAKWRPELSAIGLDEATNLLTNIQKKIDDLETEIAAKREQLGAAKQSNKQQENSTNAIETLEKQAGSIDRIKEKLERDTKELAELEEKVAQMKSAQSLVKIPDPLMASFCEITKKMIQIVDTTKGVFADHNVIDWEQHSELIMQMRTCVHDYEKSCAPDDSDLPVTKISEYEDSLRIMRNSVTNGHRDLGVAEEAKKMLDSMQDDNKETAPTVDESAIQAEISTSLESLNNWKADQQKYQSVVDQHKKRDSIIEQAAKLHQEIIDWLAIAEQLSPNGIPAELLAGAINPINERLLSSSQDSWMLRPEIHDDMTITATKENSTTKIPYALLSESEQWRVDAMIAEAISHITGIGVLVLDRFDVLDVRNRGDLIGWLDQLAADKDIDTCIIFGTLKEPPKRLPDTFTAYWIDDGIATEAKAEKVAA